LRSSSMMNVEGVYDGFYSFIIPTMKVEVRKVDPDWNY